jgi:hypothetical protein
MNAVSPLDDNRSAGGDGDDDPTKRLEWGNANMAEDHPGDFGNRSPSQVQRV